MTNTASQDELLVVDTVPLLHGLQAIVYRRLGPAPPRRKVPPPLQPQPKKTRRTRR